MALGNAKPNIQAISTPNRHDFEAGKDARTSIHPASSNAFVDWEPGDPDDPLNWSMKRKLLAMALVASMAMVG